MKVAISTDNGLVSAHFGRCPQFTIVDIEGGQVTHRETVNNPGHAPGLIPEFLNGKGVKCIVAGGMGGRAQQLFNEYGIEAMIGVIGSVDETIEKIAKGTLEAGQSLCSPGAGKGYGIDKNVCDHEGGGHEHDDERN